MESYYGFDNIGHAYQIHLDHLIILHLKNDYENGNLQVGQNNISQPSLKKVAFWHIYTCYLHAGGYNVEFKFFLHSMYNFEIEIL